MDAFHLEPNGFQARLARLHEASFGWALNCWGWNEADAEDVLQTTYLKVVSGQARFGGKSEFRTWLFGVIRQTAREHHRRAGSHRERARRLYAEMEDEGGFLCPGDPAGRSETRLLLLQATSQLPGRQQEVLHLVFYEDLTIREAAKVMGVSLGSARVHYETC